MIRCLFPLYVEGNNLDEEIIVHPLAARQNRFVMRLSNKLVPRLMVDPITALTAARICSEIEYGDELAVDTAGMR